MQEVNLLTQFISRNSEKTVASTKYCSNYWWAGMRRLIKMYRDYGDYEPDFADPGGTSALRRAHKSNPRNLPCPTCGEPNRLTPRDRDLGYQCDECADRAEGGGY